MVVLGILMIIFIAISYLRVAHSQEKMVAAGVASLINSASFAS
jgi:hypothetical protein